MRKLISLILTCSILMGIMCIPLQAEAAYTPTFEVTSQSVYLVNTDTGKVIYEKNKDQELYPASLVKMMTAIVTIEYCEQQGLDLSSTMVTAPSYVFDDLYGKNASNADIRNGEVLSMEDLLYALMLASACEAAGIIADYVSNGNPEAFIQMMNDKATELGCEHTVFKNPSGLDEEGQKSTAYDMYLIADYGMKNETFEKIATSQSYTMKATNKHAEERRIVHTNFMLNMNLGGQQYFYEYVRGIKTGTSDEYKNLVTTARKDSYNYICVVMGAPIYDTYGNALPVYTYLDTKALYKWVFESFELKLVAEPGKKSIPNNIKVELAKDTDSLNLTVKEPVSELLPKDIDVSTIMWDTSRLPATISAPIQEGQVIGQVDLKLQNEVIQTVDVVAAQSVERSNWEYFKYIAKNVVTSWWFILIVVIIVLLLIAYFVLVVLYNRRRRKRRRNRYSTNVRHHR